MLFRVLPYLAFCQTCTSVPNASLPATPGTECPIRSHSRLKQAPVPSGNFSRYRTTRPSERTRRSMVSPLASSCLCVAIPSILGISYSSWSENSTRAPGINLRCSDVRNCRRRDLGMCDHHQTANAAVNVPTLGSREYASARRNLTCGRCPHLERAREIISGLTSTPTTDLAVSARAFRPVSRPARNLEDVMALKQLLVSFLFRNAVRMCVERQIPRAVVVFRSTRGIVPSRFFGYPIAGMRRHYETLFAVLSLEISNNHAHAFRETLLDVEISHVPVAHKVDHVEVSNLFAHPPDKLGANALALVCRQYA